MITYTRVDCVGASKGLFFGLLVLVSALICLILFFVLIDHSDLHVSQLAVFSQFFQYFWDYVSKIPKKELKFESFLQLSLSYCVYVLSLFQDKADEVPQQR